MVSLVSSETVIIIIIIVIIIIIIIIITTKLFRIRMYLLTAAEYGTKYRIDSRSLDHVRHRFRFGSLQASTQREWGRLTWAAVYA